MEKSEKDNLVNELKQLSQDIKHNKQRMIEIAKILLADHYWYNKQTLHDNDVEDANSEAQSSWD